MYVIKSIEYAKNLKFLRALQLKKGKIAFNASLSGGYLEQLLCTELENIVDILLAEVGALAAHAGLDNQMGQHHLLLGHLGDTLLHSVPKRD